MLAEQVVALQRHLELYNYNFIITFNPYYLPFKLYFCVKK